jgi:uncharacterized protein YjbI with pentapeptide repeats
MATQTRLTTRRSVRFLRATIAAYMMVACCGLILLSAVSAYAIGYPTGNGMPFKGLPGNGANLNGANLNGTSLQGSQYRGRSLPSVQSENLPWDTLSHKRLGKSPH